jgi:hypothetical protein
MEDMEDLFVEGQAIIETMTATLDGSYRDRLTIAFSMSRLKVCSLRVRRSAPQVECYHAISHVMELPSNEKSPFFTVTFEEHIGEQVFDISLGFCDWGESRAMFQVEGCYDCGNEEFCTKQPAEVDLSNFSFYYDDMEEVVNSYVRLWAPVLADFAASFGEDTMYELTGYILDQVFDGWSDIPDELESTIRLFTFNERIERLIKDPDYCSKDECEDSVYERGLCLSHEDFCAITDCFDYKDEGAFCFTHTPM